MLSIKQKFLVVSVFVSTILSQFLFFTPTIVYANHDTCEGSADSIERCVTSLQNAENVKCFENNTEDSAKAECVNNVAAHYTYAGAPEDAPPIAGGAPKVKCDGTQDSTVICAPECIYRDRNGNCTSCNIKDESGSCNLFHFIDLAISFVAAIMGIVVVIMIIVGGIQYSVAGADFNAVAKAKKRIGSAIGALLAFALLYAIIQYLVPGGIF